MYITKELREFASDHTIGLDLPHVDSPLTWGISDENRIRNGKGIASDFPKSQ